MRLIFVILFLTAVVTNEMVFDLLILQYPEISLCDTSKESSSEKETQVTTEDESKTDYFSDNHSGAASSFKLYKSATSDLAATLRTPYLEILSPPPDCC